MASSYPPICSPLSPNPAVTVLHSPALPPSFHRSSSTPSSSYASSLYSTGYDSTLESASSLVQKYLSSPVSPQPPALYQVPAFGRSASPVNGAFNSAMAKFTSPTSGHSPTPVLLSPSFSSNTSSRSYHRPGFHNHQHHSGDQLNSHRLAFGSVGQHRKSPSAAAYGYATGRSLNKADILLDRKAFISLEKSINWQSLLNENSNGGTSGHVTSCSPTPSSGLHIGSEVESFRSAPCHHHQHHNSSRLSPVTGSPDSGQGSSSPANKTADNSPDWNSSSEQQQRDFSQPGMKDVPAWLKLLRLHKYAPFFARMPYEEMLELTEDILEHRHITKGARQKLILSIQKLKARSAVLLASEHELLLEGGRNRVGQYRVQVPYSALSKVLFQIRAFLSTPIRPLSGRCSLVGPCGILGSSNASSSSSFLVDFNNNSSSNGLVNCQSTALSAGHKELLRCWSALNSTDDLPDIMTRLIGHVHHILVEKCKKRLKKLKLWQEHFKDIHDKLAQVNTDVHLDHHLFERYPHPRDSSEGLSIPGATTATAISHANDSENDDDEDSGLLDLLEASSVNMTGERSSPASSSANGTDKDSGVDGDSDTGSLDDGEGAGGGGLSAEEEEELYLVLRTVLDKCLTHEAFTPHQALYRHWRQQLQCMISSLRHMVTADALRTGSPFGSGIKSHLDSYWSSSSRHLPAGHCKSPIPPSPGIPLQCHSPNSLNKHNNNNKVSMTTFQSCTKKSPSITSSCPKTTNPSPSSSVTPTAATASLSAGRRLLHNRLRSSITLGVNGGNNNSSTVSSALHRNGQLICSSPEEVSRSFDRRSCFKSTTSKTSETSSHHISASTLYSNLSVIPRLSATLFPSAGAPAVGHGHSNTAFTGNSPEANLRNLLLQQLLTTQQQCSLSTSSSSSFMTTGHNRQTMPLPPTALDAVSSVTDSPCALSPDQLLLLDSSLINNSISTPPGEVTTTTSIDSYSANCGQLPATTLTVAATGDNEQHVCRSTAPAAQSTAALDNGCSDSRWSLHGGGHLDDDETKKHLDWNASAGLLSSLQYTANTTAANVSSKETNGGKQLQEMLCFNLFDNNMEMSNCWPGVNSSYPTTATVSSDNGITGFDDIEQLCIRMAEHALDINDDSIYS